MVIVPSAGIKVAAWLVHVRWVGVATGMCTDSVAVMSEPGIVHLLQVHTVVDRPNAKATASGCGKPRGSWLPLSASISHRT